jgi:S-adenosylmethionine:tRNA-ribosyltransferase-isomerase (queuine synthetase)
VQNRSFLTKRLNAEQRLWDVLVDPARKIRIGNKLYFGDDDSLVAEVIDNTTSRGEHYVSFTMVHMKNSEKN